MDEHHGRCKDVPLPSLPCDPGTLPSCWYAPHCGSAGSTRNPLVLSHWVTSTRCLCGSAASSAASRTAVLQDVASFEETQETLALLKILALGNRDVEAGKVRPVAEVVARLRSERATG